MIVLHIHYPVNFLSEKVGHASITFQRRSSTSMLTSTQKVSKANGRGQPDRDCLAIERSHLPPTSFACTLKHVSRVL